MHYYSHSLEEHDGLEGVVVGGEGGDESVSSEVPGHGVGATATSLAPGPGLLHQLAILVSLDETTCASGPSPLTGGLRGAYC